MKEVLIQTLTSIAISLIGLAGSYVLFLIGKTKAKINEATAKQIQDDTQKKLFDNAVNRVGILAEHIVTHTQQTVVDDLKKAIADGTIDKTELQQIGKDTVEKVYGQLSTETKSVLEEELKDVKGYIENVVESSVYKLKQK